MNVFIFCFGTHKSTFESVHQDKANIMYFLLYNCYKKKKNSRYIPMLILLICVFEKMYTI